MSEKNDPVERALYYLSTFNCPAWQKRELRQALKQAKKDRDRLDWLGKSRQFQLGNGEFVVVFSEPYQIAQDRTRIKVRGAIDAAMKKDKRGRKP